MTILWQVAALTFAAVVLALVPLALVAHDRTIQADRIRIANAEIKMGELVTMVEMLRIVRGREAAR